MGSDILHPAVQLGCGKKRHLLQSLVPVNLFKWYLYRLRTFDFLFTELLIRTRFSEKEFYIPFSAGSQPTPPLPMALEDSSRALAACTLSFQEYVRRLRAGDGVLCLEKYSDAFSSRSLSFLKTLHPHFKD